MLQVLILFLTYQTVAAQLSTGSVSTAGTPPDAPWLLTSNGAGTAATTPKHLSLPNAGGLAYPANGGAALHDTSFTYAKPPTSPPLPNDVAYTAPNIGAPIVPYPSLLQMSSTTMPPIAPTTSTAGLNIISGMHHPMFHNPNYVTSPLTPPLVSVYPGVAVHHQSIQIPKPGNGFAGFVTGHSYLNQDTSTSIYPNYMSNPYVIQPEGSNGASAQQPAGSFQYPAFLDQSQQRRQKTTKELPASAKWITPPDPKNKFGAGVPLTPSNDIRPGAGTAPFPGINANKGTVMMYGSNSPSKFEDP